MNSESILSTLLTALKFVFDASAVLLVAWIGTAVAKKNPGLRHALWSTAFVAILLLPVFLLVHPTQKSVPIQIPLPSKAPAFTSAAQLAPTLKSADLPMSQAMTAPVHVAAHSQPDWPLAAQAFLAVWFAGSALLLSWMAFAYHGLLSLRRVSKPTRWREGEFERLSARLNLRRSVQLRLSTVPVPVSALTWGTLRPVILLPQGSDTWSDAQRELVLLHELAHVKRFDCFFQLIATFVGALFWFHPAVWFASASMRTEAEQAADDAVIQSGVRATDYASNLVTLAALFGTSRQPRISLGVFLMKRSGIETRVRSIIDPSRRKRGATKPQVVAIAAVVALVVFALANLRPILYTAPDIRESLFEDAIYSATKHQRDKADKLAAEKWAKIHKANHPEEFQDNALPVAAAKPHKAPHQTFVIYRHKLPARHTTPVTVASNTVENAPFSTEPVFAASVPKLPAIPLPEKPPANTWQAPQIEEEKFNRDVAQVKEARLAAHEQAREARFAAQQALIQNRISKFTQRAITAVKPVQVILPLQRPAATPVAPFHAIRIDGKATVVLKIGPSESCGVTCDQWQPNQNDCKIENGVLHIPHGEQTTIYATAPSLDRLEVDGSSIVQCSGVSAKNFTLVENGASSVRIDGRATTFHIDLNGSSSLLGQNMVACELTEDINGSSSSSLHGNFTNYALQADGSSSAAAVGIVNHFVVAGRGSSSVDTSALLAQTVVAFADGASHMKVNASQKFSATAHNNAAITCTGKPEYVRTSPDDTSKINL